MNFLKKLGLYTSKPTQSTENFIDVSNNLINDFDAMERVIKTIKNNSKREEMLKNLDMSRKFITNNFDIYHELMNKGLF